MKIIVVVRYPQKSKVYNIEINTDDKVIDLIEELRPVLEDTRPDMEVTILYQNITLQNQRTFASYNITKGAELIIQIQTVGGNDGHLII